MAMIDFWASINVPKNKKGEEEMQYIMRTEENVKTYSLPLRDIETLSSLFDQFNARFDIIIDSHEDEQLPAKYVGEALDMTRNFEVEHLSSSNRVALETLVEALEFARKRGTFVEFFF